MRVPVVHVFLCCLLTVSCGGSSPTAPSVERVSGAWIGHSTLASASGGECVGASLDGVRGARDIFSARIQQTGSELAASVTYQGNQTSCLYRGSSQNGSVDLTMDSCPSGRIESFACANGAMRDLEIVGGRLTGRAVGRTGTGTETLTVNVFAPGGATSLGTATIATDFTWNMLGIPHDDFHIFDGSILPGYVDGVVIIPEEQTPFCTFCGWF
jgi:hypothetical protein